MFTLVGIQEDFGNAIKNLIELDYDAVEAYEVAYMNLANSDFKQKIDEFKQDHTRHIKEFTNLLTKHNIKAPTGPSIGNQWLTKGKVIVGSLIGDMTVLRALLNNEIDTNTAYERMCFHENKWADADDLLNNGLADEKIHKAWLKDIIK